MRCAFSRPLLCTGLLAAALALSSAPAGADDLPVRKPGLWRIDSHIPGVETRSLRQCIDATTTSTLLMFGQNFSRENCDRNEVHRTGNIVKVEYDCSVGETHLFTRGTITVHADTSYHSAMSVHFDPPSRGRNEIRWTSDTNWLGTCPATMKPGDTVLPDGRRLNLQTLGQTAPADP